MTNQPVSTSLYGTTIGTQSTNVFVDHFDNRDPTSNDTQFQVQKKWLNTTNGKFWELKSYSSSAGVVSANWILIGGTGMLDTLTGNTGGSVSATSNNINIIGDGTYITVAGNPGTSTLTIQPAGALTTLYTENTGTATPSSGNLNILGSQGISTTGSGSTITAIGQPAKSAGSSSLSNLGVASFNNTEFTVDSNGFVGLVGGGAAIEKVNVQTGTSPIVPSSGAITINGATVSAGTNPVRTDGTGANTMAVEVQIAQAIASTDATKIGLSNFDSSKFSVDANGFVGLSTSFYATGTFTPVLKFGGGTTGITYSIQTGTYTRTGNLIFIMISIALTSKGSSTGAATVTGLPITSTAGNNLSMFTNLITLDANYTYFLGSIGASSTTLALDEEGNNVGNQALLDSNFANSSAFNISGFYFG